jgi:hypothetical protein
MTDLRCNVQDFTVPTSPPMTCGFPATCTVVAPDGTTVGICRSHETAAAAAGYVVTPVETAPER